MPVMRNHAGRTFGRITLSEPVPGKAGYWKGTCSCGHPVEKRIDNLKRPGDHSCGTCPAQAPVTDANLEERVRQLEEAVASLAKLDSTKVTPFAPQVHRQSRASCVEVDTQPSTPQ